MHPDATKRSIAIAAIARAIALGHDTAPIRAAFDLPLSRPTERDLMLTATVHTATDLFDFCRRLSAIPRDVAPRIKPAIGPTEMPTAGVYTDVVITDDGLTFEEVAVALDVEAGVWSGWTVEEEEARDGEA